MRAIYLEGINKPFELIEVPRPEAGPGEAIVQVKAAALNHRDVWIQHGRYFTKEYPAILGADGAGVVTETGDGVDPNWLGQQVLIDPTTDWGDNPQVQAAGFKVLGMPEAGTFADFVKVRAANLHPKPGHLTFEEAAALPLAGTTAYRAMFTKCGLQPGEKVLITGAGGGVALLAVQLAVAIGAAVWVTSGSDEKLAKAGELGAAGGINYRLEGWGKTLKQRIGGFDVILDSAGGEGFAQLLKLALPGGRIAVYGGTTGLIQQVNPADIFWKQLTIFGSTMGTAADFAAMVKLVSGKQLKPVIDRVFPLEETEQAMRYMESGKQFGKIIVKVGA